ncbi:AAA domain-containing protein [Psychrosphaera sp.]|nr:AAA domain-containing protein [Psychrosphaera sp.]
MDIECLDPLGINAFERKANDVLSEHLPNSWKGYSGLEMHGRQAKDFQSDIIIITHDRIIVVELKNYIGRIYSTGNKWVQEYSDGRQEQRTHAVSQANRAAKILKSKLQDKLKGKYVPYVDKVVVLCGSATSADLPDGERECVLSLDEFKNIGDEKFYKKYFGKSFSFSRKEDFPNKNIRIWDRIFLNNSADFKPKRFSSNNYVINSSFLFQHKDGLYKEYESQRADNANYKALMRRWDFTSPCIIEHSRTPEQRAVLAQRESNVLGYIDTQDEDLKNSHLNLIHIPSELTEDFVELYEWPNRKERLDTFIRKNNNKLTDSQRLDLMQMLISQLSRLHDIEVAHRDLGPHSIWLSLPSKVVLSNFLTAYYPDPDKNSVSFARKIIQHGRVETPEELFEDESHGTAFTRDVYLATAACHFIAFGEWPRKEEGIYVWKKLKNNSISDKLSDWFARGLELDTRERFQDLAASLTEFNKLLNSKVEDSAQALSAFLKYHDDSNVFVDFGAVPVKSDGTYHLLKGQDETFGLKVWFGVNEVTSSGEINHQLLAFFSRLESIKNSNLDILPKILGFGFNPTMTSVYFKYEWLNGTTWEESIQSLEKNEAFNLSKKLLSALIKLNAAKLYHGDLHPKNVIIHEGDVRFIDLAEYNLIEAEKFTPAYIPASYESLQKSAIDRFAAIKMVKELATKFMSIHLIKYTKELLELPEISTNELERFLDNFDLIVNPPPLPKLEKYEVNHKSFNTFDKELVSDDGQYYISLSLNAGKSNDLLGVQLSGVKTSINLLIEEKKKFIVGASVRELRHDQFIRNKRDSLIKLTGSISLTHKTAASSEGFIDFILNSEAYKSLSNEKPVQPQPLNRTTRTLSLPSIAKSSVVDAREIWKVLVETEEESYPKIQVATEPHYALDQSLSFSYSLADSKFDFDIRTERVNVKTDVRGEMKVVGVVQRLGSDTISIKPKTNINIEVGDTLTLEGSMSAASLSKREKAVTKLITGRAVINNLPDYFSPGLVAEHTDGEPPTDSELDSYTEYDDDNKIVFSLNEQQRDAFKTLYKYGPVALLQGPPGTGKTAFIGSYIHYSIRKGARRVLLVSQSHEAVNNASEKVRSLFRKNEEAIDIVRLGDETNLSASLTDVGEKALQEHYRDKFRAEYIERLCTLLEHIGIPEEMAVLIAEFEASFGQKFDQLLSQTKDKDLADTPELRKREAKLKENLENFLSRNSAKLNSFANVPTENIRDSLLRDLAALFEIYSQQIIFKVKNVIETSNEWLSVMASGKAQFQNFLAKTRTLVCGTCVGIGRHHYGIQENLYDLVVIDEAARSPASELAIAMQVGKKVLLVGDHKQLPPLYDENHIKAAKRELPKLDEKELKRSDFERAFVSDYGRKVGRSLLMQYRMCPPIGNLVSSNFYEGALSTGRGDTAIQYKNLIAPFASTVTWFDTSSAGKKGFESKPKGRGVNENSYVNAFEADSIISIIERMYENDKDGQTLSEGEEPKIGVICMYAEQVRLLVKKINSISWARNLLEKRILKVDTVDSYQGKENDIIILSLVRNNSNFKQGHVSSENRANVSLSRAKEALFIVGNSEMWSENNKESAFGRVLHYIKGNETPEYAVRNVLGGEK